MLSTELFHAVLRFFSMMKFNYKKLIGNLQMSVSMKINIISFLNVSLIMKNSNLLLASEWEKQSLMKKMVLMS